MEDNQKIGLSRNPIKTVDHRFCPAVFKTVLYSLFFLLPLFFLPWTTDWLEINKQTLFVLLVGIMAVTWFCTIVLTRRMSFRLGWLSLLPLFLLLGAFLSSLLSVAGYVSWVGQGSQEYVSFLSLVMFVVLFILLANEADQVKIQRRLVLTLLVSATLAGLVGLLSVFGINLLPGTGTQVVNSVGTFSSLIAFLLVVMFMGLGMWLVSNKTNDGRFWPPKIAGGFCTLILILLCLITLLFLIALDFWVFWIVAIIGVLGLFVFALIQNNYFKSRIRFAVPLVILLISIVFLFFPSPLKLNIPISISPSVTMSWHVANQAISGNANRMLFGTGPGTYGHDYAQFKPAQVNQTVFWNSQFDRASSHLITIFTTMGVFGAVIWLALVLIIFFKSLNQLLRPAAASEWKINYVLFLGWFLITFIHFIYVSNFTLQFLFWGLSGLLVSRLSVKMFKSDFARSPRLALGAVFIFVLLIVGVLTSVFVVQKRYAAELAFDQAVALASIQAPIDQVIDQLTIATKHNPLNDFYYRNLSQALLFKASELDVRTSQNKTQKDIDEIQGLVSAGVASATRATELEPNNVLNWVARGAIYRDLMPFAQNAEDFAALSLQNAISLEPTNPAYYTDLGRIYLAVAARAQALRNSDDQQLAAQAAQAEAEQVLAAERVLTTAIQLKPDYALAHYYLASVYERQGRLSEAALRLAELTQVSPQDVGLGFELALMLLRLQELDLAQVEFERVLSMAPDYSNAMWFLASVYELQNNRTEALAMVQKVASLNPKNQIILRRLERMRKGELTTIIPQPIDSRLMAPVEGLEVMDQESMNEFEVMDQDPDTEALIKEPVSEPEVQNKPRTKR
ncbi:tetratricopeptide repeat protein [Patescibacteria group bacterium]